MQAPTTEFDAHLGDATERTWRQDASIAPPRSLDGTRLKERSAADQTGDAPGEGPGPEPLSGRLLRPETVISFGVAIAIIFFFFRRLDIDYRAVWSNARHANPALYALAFVVYYASFFARAIRWRIMLKQAGLHQQEGFRVPATPRLVEIFLLSWFVNCVVPAKLGDGYRCYLLKRDTGAPFSTTLGTVLAERLTDLTVLFLTMTGMGIVAFHGQLPAQATKVFAGGLALIVLATVGVAVMWFSRDRLHPRLPERIQAQYIRLHDAVFACLRRPGRPVAISLAIWSGDGIRFYLVAKALGASVSWPVATFIALMGALLTTLPITPAGLGILEVAVIGMLKFAHVDDVSLAGAIVLLDRVVTYWSLILVGLALYIRQLHSNVKEPSGEG